MILDVTFLQQCVHKLTIDTTSLDKLLIHIDGLGVGTLSQPRVHVHAVHAHTDMQMNTCAHTNTPLHLVYPGSFGKNEFWIGIQVLDEDSNQDPPVSLHFDLNVDLRLRVLDHKSKLAPFKAKVFIWWVIVALLVANALRNRNISSGMCFFCTVKIMYGFLSCQYQYILWGS